MKTYIVVYFGKVIDTVRMSAKLTPFEVERRLIRFGGFPKNALFIPDRRNS